MEQNNGLDFLEFLIITSTPDGKPTHFQKIWNKQGQIKEFSKDELENIYSKIRKFIYEENFLEMVDQNLRNRILVFCLNNIATEYDQLDMYFECNEENNPPELVDEVRIRLTMSWYSNHKKEYVDFIF